MKKQTETELRKILTEVYKGQKENNDEAVERILLLLDVAGRSEQLCQHDRSVTNRICDDCGSVITYVPDDELA